MPRLREPALGRWRPSGMKRFLPLVAAAGLIVAACASGSPSGSSATAGEPPSPSATPPAALAPAGDCDALLDYFIDQALSQVGPYGLGGWGGPIVDAVAEEAATDSAGDGGQPAGGEDPTSTNVQVEGVDEGDIVKAAGDH